MMEVEGPCVVLWKDSDSPDLGLGLDYNPRHKLKSVLVVASLY